MPQLEKELSAEEARHLASTLGVYIGLNKPKSPAQLVALAWEEWLRRVQRIRAAEQDFGFAACCYFGFVLFRRGLCQQRRSTAYCESCGPFRIYCNDLASLSGGRLDVSGGSL
jgi:hypothetical protein